jgi:choline oxidase
MIDAGEFDDVIADGSTGPKILPFLPTINPCITTMMIGEKCRNMLTEDARAEARAVAA